MNGSNEAMFKGGPQGPAKWTARLSPVVAASLQNAGIREPVALVRRLQSKTEVLSLSRTTGIKATALVGLAARTEIVRVLGEQNVSLENLQLLECAGLGTPTELGTFAGREADCVGYLGYIARSLRVATPTEQQVTAWVQAAAQGISNLPDPRTLLPEVGKGQPRPFRARSIGEGRSPRDLPTSDGSGGGGPSPETPTPSDLPTGTTEYGQADISIAALAAAWITIKSGQSEGHKEFEATDPGLYRADISLRRKGGYITMGWAIDKPGKPKVEASPLDLLLPGFVKVLPGYTPIRQGDEKTTGRPFGQGDYSLYFWIRPTDISASGKLRLRLVVEKNEDAPPAKPPKPPGPGQVGDPDYHGPETPSEEPDPTITGSVVVTRQTATPIEYGKPCTVPWYSQNGAKPVQSFRAPLYTPPGGAAERAFRLTVSTVTDPNFYQDYLPDWAVSSGQAQQGMTGHPANEGRLVPPCVFRDGANVVSGEESHSHGVCYLDHAGAVPNGIYEVVIGADRTQLMETGCLLPRRYEYVPPDIGISVMLSLQGGKVETWYVPELQYLRLSSQGSHPDDHGFGDFVIETHAILGKAGAVSGAVLQQQKLSDLPPWAVQWRRFELQDIPTPGPWTTANRATWCAPHLALGRWTPEQIEKFNVLTLGVGVRAMHQRTFWESVQETFDPIIPVFELLISAGKTIFAAYGGNVGGAISNFSDFLHTAMHMDDQKANRQVEYFGEPCLTTGKEWDWPWGVMDNDALARWFEIKATADSKSLVAEPVSWADEKTRRSGAPGCVTDYTGEPTNWVWCEVRMRKVAAPYSTGWVDSIQFTTTDDPCPQWGYGVLYGLSGPDCVFGAEGTQVAGPFREGTDFNKYDDINDLPYEQWVEKQAHPVYWWKWGVTPGDMAKSIVSFGLCPQAYTGLHLHLRSHSPGVSATPIGALDFTFYHEDFWRNCGRTLDFSESLGWKATFGKDGAFYYGDYELRYPGLYLDTVKFRVYVYIWEGQ